MEQKRLDKLVGQATRLVDLADYQEGSVVSRTVRKQVHLPFSPLPKDKA
jgi:hypothetical protein